MTFDLCEDVLRVFVDNYPESTFLKKELWAELHYVNDADQRAID